jgi:hypothetical protein
VEFEGGLSILVLREKAQPEQKIGVQNRRVFKKDKIFQKSCHRPQRDTQFE